MQQPSDGQSGPARPPASGPDAGPHDDAVRAGIATGWIVQIVLLYAAFAAAWILYSDKAVTLLFEAPEHVLLANTLKGWLFVAVTAGLLFLVLGRLARRVAHSVRAPTVPAAGAIALPQAGAPADAGRGPRSLWLPYTLLVTAIVAAVVSSVWVTFRQHRAQEGERLRAIAQLKVAQVELWLAERRADTRVLASRAQFAELHQAWRTSPGGPARARLLAQLAEYRSAYGYQDLLVVEAGGVVAISVERAPEELPERLASAIERARVSGGVEETDLYRAANGRVHMDFVVPIAANGGGEPTLVVLRVDPSASLLDGLRKWPLPAASAEVVLLRNDGRGHLEVMTNPRGPVTSGYSGRHPIGDPAALAPRVFDTNTPAGALLDGVDYRNVPIRGVGLQVPGTDWVVVAKVDRDEFYAPAVEAGTWIGLAGLLGLLVVTAALVVVHQRRTLQFSAALQERQAERLRALQLLDSIASSSTDVIYAKDVDGRYLLHNPAADRLTAREPGAVIGQDDRAIYPPEEAAALMANDRRVMTSGAVSTFEETLPLADGPRTMLSTKGPLRDAEGRVIGLFGISHDVTEMRRAQKALAEDAVRRRILIEQSRDAIVVLDEEAGIHESNARFAQMLGRTVEEAAGLRVWDWDPDWPRERILKKLRDFDRASQVHETRWTRKDGSLFPVEVASTAVEWAGRRLVYCVCRDITERKRAEQALIESERRWIMALDSAGHGVWDADLSSDKMFFSARWKAMLGYGDDEVGDEADEWRSRVHPDDLPGCEQALREHLAGKTTTYRIEHRLRCKDGTYKWILGQGMVAQRDPSGRPLRIVGTHTDLSWRIAAEAQLRASEERYRSMVSVLNEGILLFDREARIRATNPAAARILGVPEERLLGMSALDPSLLAVREDGSPIEPDDLPVVQCLTDGRPRRESVLGWRHASGALRWLEVNAEPIPGEPGAAPSAVTVSFTDITERREAEAQLRKLSLAVTQSPNGVQITDVDAKLEYVNAAFERMSGYSAAELLGRNPSVMASGRTPRATYDAMWAALERGDVWSGELVNRRKNGEIYVEHARIAPVRDADGRVTHYLAIKEDVTEHRRVAAELDRHRHHLQELVTERTRQLELANQTLFDRSAEIADLYNNAPCGYHSLDADGVYLSVNDTELAMLGYTREELVGRMNFRDLLVPAMRERFAHTFAKFRREGHVHDLEFEVIRKDGSLLPVTVHATVVRDASGAMLRTRSTMIDDTERRMRDREISTLNAELTRRAGEAEAANRAKSAFLANMSHEIRTPLNAILGLSHLLLRKVATPADRDKLERITQAGRHLLAIINDVLDLSKIEAGKLSLELLDFDLNPLLREVCDLVSERARAKGLDVVVDVDPALPRTLRGDRTRLLQALLNYASNAVKFTERGSVRISARVQAREGGEFVARFEVADTGIGIDPQYHDRLFGAFEQADSSTTRRYGGSGLGLAITRRLAELMGGQVGLESRPGEGSTFWFTAKLAEAAEPEPQAGPVAERADEGGLQGAHAGARVLLVDDNEINREVALELLAAVGIAADVAADGAEAVAKARGVRYDLVLMDVQMPVMDGLDATRALRAMPEHAATPIVAMTADAFSDDRDRCLAAGMNEHIAKPFEADAFYAMLARWLKAGSAPPPRVVVDQDWAAWERRLSAQCGLDVAQGLRCVLGKWPRYVELLQTYVESCADDLAKIRAGLAAGDRDAAKIRAHAMRGAASFIGATRVQALAGGLETALARRGGEARVEPALDALEAERRDLEKVLRELQAVQAAPAVDWSALAGLLARLDALVADDDVRANDVVRDAMDLLRSAFAAQAQALEHAVARFDYVAAQAAVRAMRAELVHRGHLPDGNAGEGV